jgi:cysteinyl-tRNA synthetase
MPIQLYNSLTRRKEVFVPIDPHNVRMYVCGPTVYDLAHIGNARAVVVFDQLYRLLRHTYGAAHVKYVRNITDIDDKIIDAARAGGEPIDALTARTAAAFHEDMAALGALPPDVEPRATEHIPQMIAMIARLIETQHAYEAEGHVLFAVGSWPRYGRLSRRSRQELLAGARVEVAPYKRDPGDFVLWKPSTPEQPGWDSPWGRGRPGWHIECSAMSETHLGEHFDIHGGGIDLIFPHHENELAQSESAHGGDKFVNFWVHNGFLSIEHEKMSKSLGNFTTAHELLERGIPGEVLRLALLMTHYRDPLDWTEDRLRHAEHNLNGYYEALRLRAKGEFEEDVFKSALDKIEAALGDDLNTPLALAELRKAEGIVHFYKSKTYQEVLRAGGELLGILTRDPMEWRRRGVAVSPDDMNKRITARATARRERRFADADKIRAELLAEGIVLEDRPDGTTDWRRA